uniref:F-box domain-containing protein n=1 Tax=Tanacetum cinerariifolium TaxID=118510 RepID=A0A6L2LVP1_TANCI|nr:hypothetical protein [Tanacetum cinerariifolium]
MELSANDLSVFPEYNEAESPEQPMNGESFYSANKVESIDDLLIQLLLGLPLISLHLFKSVSKHWLSLITNPTFTRFQSQNCKVDPPSGFLVQLDSVSSEFAYVSLDARIPITRSKPLITSFDFDLNPDYIELPLPNVWEPDIIIRDMAISFDPRVFPHYKVLYPVTDYSSLDIPLRIEIYSSGTGKWNVNSKIFKLQSFEGFHDCVCWRDAIHWIDYSNEVSHYNMDLENPSFIQVETPKTLDGKAYRGDKLFESSDCLLLVKMVHPLSSDFDVYKMKNDYSGWSSIYHVNLDDICVRKFCGSQII